MTVYAMSPYSVLITFFSMAMLSLREFCWPRTVLDMDMPGEASCLRRPASSTFAGIPKPNAPREQYRDKQSASKPHDVLRLRVSMPADCDAEAR